MSKVGRYSRWDTREQYLYFVFLSLKQEEFKSYASRKSSKVFDYFAHLVSSRDRRQVKSHHQKLELKHGSIRDFLQNYLSQNQHNIPHYQNQYITPKIRTIIALHLQRLQPHQKPSHLDFIELPLTHSPLSQSNYNLSQACKPADSTSETASKQQEKVKLPEVFWNEEEGLSLMSFPIPPL